VGTTPPVSPRRFDATPLLSPLPDALRATATPPLNDDPFAEANALAEAEHIPAFPSLTQPPRPAPDTFDLGTLDLTRMPAAMPKAPAASAPPSPTAENDPFLSMGHGVGTNAYPPNDNPFADAVEEHTAPVDRYAIAGSEGGVILTPSSSILPGTPEDLEIPETWDAIPGWGRRGPEHHHCRGRGQHVFQHDAVVASAVGTICLGTNCLRHRYAARFATWSHVLRRILVLTLSKNQNN